MKDGLKGIGGGRVSFVAGGRDIAQSIFSVDCV